MDRAFLEYYEEELAHVRGLAGEFAALHPAIARNLALDTVPCPDPYVERLLEGVAFLSARTRLKLDAEGGRFARAVLDALYPDLIAPTPATGMVALRPAQQVRTMRAGHVVPRGTRLVAGLRPGLSTRATYTTAQDVTLWPIEIAGAAYHQDRAALAAAGIGAAVGMSGGGGETGEAALRLTLRRSGGPLAELALDRLDLHFHDRSRAPALFDTLFGAVAAVGARPAAPPGKPGSALFPVEGPSMIGLRDDEALMPRTRPGFEGYRLLREYFMMPERFHFVRIEGLRPVVARCDGDLEVVFLLRRPAPVLADLKPADLGLFTTPIVNLFERECDMVEVDPRRPRQVLHADRARPRDFEIYRIIRLEDADRDGPEARIPALFDFDQNSGGPVWWAERRPRRAGEDERRRGRLRTSYAGDDVFVSLSHPAAEAPAKPVARLDPRALCTNRDLALIDDQPALTLESGDPVQGVTLIGSLRPPRPALAPGPETRAGESRADELAWRLVAQLSLNHLGLAVEGQALEPLRATLELYADRGDPALARHVRGLTAVTARPVIERLPVAGPMCFGRGTEITLEIDETRFAGHAALLLPALLARLFARYAAVNAFARTRTRLARGHEEVSWPMTLGNRGLI
ncbi:type VI secretion system baseplate subunit TssF [Amaricoccus solimangrovi]|uniref:Type VI secretion system baseplate subunit TssF n=1 Tax=Amaricoccus solimangrovi TaxID=2589815 RepID=A0A501WIA2_9RHOB|nr:type VI secretion system baseplate subunit TssF [Amaricoccus solimangrovi]TPE49098.1 type VI secretion system baseplate subunit TssF [Amaricoccus solimangrovi]